MMKPRINSDTRLEVYRSLFDNNHDASYALDTDGNFTLFNGAAMNITGLTMEEALEMNFISLLHEEYVASTIAAFKRVIEGKRERFETAILKKTDGHRVDLLVTVVPITVGNKVIGVVGTAQDITKKKELELLVRGQNQILQMIAKGAPLKEVLENIIVLIEKFTMGTRCSILLVDKDKKKLVHGASPNLPLGYSEAVNGIPIGPCVGSCGTAAYLKRPVTVIDIGSDPLWSEYKDVALANGLRACWSAPVFDNCQNVIAAFGMYYNEICYPRKKDLKTIKNATDLISLAIQHYLAKDEIKFMAYHDALTGLPNRRLFDEKVRQAITKQQQEKAGELCLMYLDLDRFKLVNDSLGHKVGDKLLQGVSEKLLSCIGNDDTISRQGGDEFTILLENTTRKKAVEVAESILAKLTEVITIDGNEIFITTSIGLSFYPEDGEEFDMLLSKADVAMYQAKKQGRNNLQLYDVMLDQQALKKMRTENELRKAMERNELSLHYQPIFHLATKKITGAEALLRWKNHKCGMISPQHFIPIAEETGLIVPIGEWVLKTACLQLKQWHSEGLSPLTISVNLSVRQFYQHNLIQMIKDTLVETGVEPKWLTIEITESMTMDVETATIILQELKEIGVNISIDDFGTGYSSLNYLKTFPIDHLKIDRTFIRDIAESKSDENIATTIILMAHNLGLSVIAEGVETLEQLSLLELHECNEAQGFYFSKPMEPQGFRAFYKKNSEAIF